MNKILNKFKRDKGDPLSSFMILILICGIFVISLVAHEVTHIFQTVEAHSVCWQHQGSVIVYVNGEWKDIADKEKQAYTVQGIVFSLLFLYTIMMMRKASKERNG